MQTIAIYSRKSKFTGKGDSIENQIEMCKEYIRQRIGVNDKDIDIKIYEDEGFSGGTIDRPQFKKLMKDVKLKQINILICYRLDRISRNVADFSNTLEILQENNCSFISIKEQFDTSTPMGKAMLYIASVFAQLERETIAERVKDNMLELAKNGRWTGGKIPVGFVSERIKYNDQNGLQREYPILKQDPEEINFVKFLYKKYLELGSLHKLEGWITENEIKSKNGIMYEKSTLKIILQNTIYVKSTTSVFEYLKEKGWVLYGNPDNVHSLLSYNKTEQVTKNGKSTKALKDPSERFAAVSGIEGALEPELWLAVQRKFDKNRDAFPAFGKGKTHNALLVGKLKCGICGEYMLVQHGKISKTTGKKLFYYMCSLKRKSHKKLCDNPNAKADYIENLVIQSLKKLSIVRSQIINTLKENNEAQNKVINENCDKFYLEKSLEEKKLQIDNLVTKLSKSDGIEDIILDKIKSLKADCEAINKNLLNFENCVSKTKAEKINIELIENLLAECEFIDTFDRERQKHLIDTLIEVVKWTGTGNGKGKITIKFVGADDENTQELDFNCDDELAISKLQFGSHSTCKTNDYLLPA